MLKYLKNEQYQLDILFKEEKEEEKLFFKLLPIWVEIVHYRM